MKLTKTKLAAAFLSAALFAAAGIQASGKEGKEEPAFSGDISEAVLGLVKGLPEIWRVSREAGKIAKTLPDYEGEVPVPDSELIYSWLSSLCATPHRRPGTREGHRAEKWLRDKMVELGLQDVRMDPVPLTVWSAERWSLSVEGEEIPSFFVVNTGFTPEEGITAPLVYVGEGKPKDFAKREVKGKLVVAEVPFPYLPTGLMLKGLRAAYAISDPENEFGLFSGQYLNFVRMNFLGVNLIGEDEEFAPPENDVYWNSYKRGALGICLILKNQPSRYNTHYGPYDGFMKPMPGLWIGKYDGARLRELAKEGKTATLVLTGRKEPGVMHNVWGRLPGRSDEVILVTSHSDSPWQGAVEDAAGSAQVLAQAWAWSQVPKERRPRTLVFVIDSGHFYGSKGAHEFARSHPEIMKRTKILFTLEHLAAKEVKEKDGEYEPTGRLALTVMFTSRDPLIVAALKKAFAAAPPRITASIPADMFGKAPTSDAAGYVLEAGVPVISWIGCPYYLLDSGDTLDKIEKEELAGIARAATEIVKVFMAME